jgi:hypothetical protein
MHGTYLQNKKSVYNWVAKNKSKNRAINSKAVDKYQNWKKIQKVFLHILL